MNPKSFSVVYEDNHLLVVNKPAGLATMGVQADQPSLIHCAKSYIKAKYDKPGNVFLGIVSRLDTPVTGVVTMARTSKAASRLSAQFRDGTVEKTYWAVVSDPVDLDSEELLDWIRKPESKRKVRIVADEKEGAQLARLRYRVLDRIGPNTLLEVELLTGRKHQIRVQLSHAGFPIVGDLKYGSRKKFPLGIALHAYSVSVSHPTTREKMTFSAEPPTYWPKSWRSFRGRPG